MSALRTETVSINDLRPHPSNPRRGNVKLIAESLKVNGQYKPIVVARDGVILAGNHTWLAARGIDWDTIEIVRLDIDHDSDQAKRILLADNRTADDAGYDTSELTELLEALPTLDGTGYDRAGLDSLLEQLQPTEGYTPDIEGDAYDGVVEYAVVCVFSTEDEQRQAYEKLKADGYECKVLVA